jgi:hypothetical protein
VGTWTGLADFVLPGAGVLERFMNAKIGPARG